MSDLEIQSEHVRRAVKIMGGQKKLARAIDRSQQYVSALTNGRYPCSAEAAVKIDDATAGVVSAKQLRPDLFDRQPAFAGAAA
jgi:DNA-binding transcriptional regulator YdaS (Cro superfamily)